METEYTYMLTLLGDFLHERVPKPEPEADWKKLVLLSQIHCVTGILGYMTMRAPICPDPELRKALQTCCKRTVTEFVQRSAAMDSLVEQLNQAGVDHILMKGYVLRSCYPVPDLRTYGDIDFVIHPRDRQTVHRLLVEQGFQVETDWEPVYSYRRGMEFYEVHTDIMEVDVSPQADTRAYFQSMWAHVFCVRDHTWQFSREYHFLYLLTHIAKHIQSSGAGARMYLDVAAYIRSFGGELDWDYIQEQLQTMNLLRFARVALTCVERWFGVTCPIRWEDPDEVLLEDFRIFTMEAGVFGHFQRDTGLNDLKKLKSGKKTSRFSWLLGQMFPPAGQIRSRYTYLQKHPWLLPVAWIHRLIVNRGNWNRRAHEAQTVLNGHEAEAQRLKRITQGIGL